MVAEVPEPQPRNGLAELVDQLHATLGRFALALALPRDGFVWIDQEARIIWCNAAFDRMVDADHIALLGAPLVERLVLERAGQPITGDVHPAHRILVETGMLEETYEMPKGVNRAIVEVVARRGLIDGKVSAVVVIREVTERVRATRALEAMNTRLEEANGELEAFSYSVSHDLRKPLRAIDGFSQALLEECGAMLDETGRGYLARVRNAVQAMGQLIEDMLRLSRVTRHDLVRTDVDLSAMCRSIVNELAASTPERSVEVSIADQLVARGDAHLLYQALQNLLENAWKFTGKTPHARIEVGSMTMNGMRAFVVRDNGAGFEMAHADTLFGTFQRLHSTSEFPGTGIGLAIVRRIIHRHGGRVWADAAEGKGASFYFTLPSETESAP